MRLSLLLVACASAQVHHFTTDSGTRLVTAKYPIPASATEWKAVSQTCPVRCKWDGLKVTTEHLIKHGKMVQWVKGASPDENINKVYHKCWHEAKTAVCKCECAKWDVDECKVNQVCSTCGSAAVALKGTPASPGDVGCFFGDRQLQDTQCLATDKPSSCTVDCAATPACPTPSPTPDPYSPECGADLKTLFQTLFTWKEPYGNGKIEKTINLKACEYVWRSYDPTKGRKNRWVGGVLVPGNGVFEFPPGTNVKVAGAGKGKTTIRGTNPDNGPCMVQIRTGRSQGEFFRTGRSYTPETPLKVVFEDLTIAGFANGHAIMRIKGGNIRFNHVQFASNFGTLIEKDPVQHRVLEDPELHQVEFDDCHFYQNKNYKRFFYAGGYGNAPFIFRNCVFEENTFRDCGGGSLSFGGYSEKIMEWQACRAGAYTKACTTPDNGDWGVKKQWHGRCNHGAKECPYFKCERSYLNGMQGCTAQPQERSCIINGENNAAEPILATDRCGTKSSLGGGFQVFNNKFINQPGIMGP